MAQAVVLVTLVAEAVVAVVIVALEYGPRQVGSKIRCPIVPF